MTDEYLTRTDAEIVLPKQEGKDRTFEGTYPWER
jgi:hypothetical protein